MLADDMACNARNPRPGKFLVLAFVTKNNNLPLTIISIHLKRLKRSLIQTKSLHTELLKSKLLFFEINYLK